MLKHFFLIIITSIFVLSILSCTSHKDSHPGHEITYICPMHPQITSNKPGQTCPICGMDLVPVSEEKDAEDHEQHSHGMTDEDGWEDLTGEISKPLEPILSHGSVRLNSEQRQKIGLVLEAVEVRELVRSVRAPGRVAFDPGLYTAQSEYIEALRQWERVKDSPLEEVRRSTQEMVRSARVRLQVLGLSDRQIRNLGPGSRLNEDLLLGRQGQKVWIYADVFEMDLMFVSDGFEVEINSPAVGIISGRVVSVDNVINPETRTATVRIEVTSSQNNLRPESFVSVRILTPLGRHLAIPKNAIVDTGREVFAFLETSEGSYKAQRLLLGDRGDEWVRVLDGVKEGQKVVVNGQFLLDSEARLRGILSSQMAKDL